MNKLIIYTISILLISISTLFLFLYLSLFNMGYNLLEYIIFCIKRIECLLFIPGIILLYKNDLL